MRNAEKNIMQQPFPDSFVLLCFINSAAVGVESGDTWDRDSRILIWWMGRVQQSRLFWICYNYELLLLRFWSKVKRGYIEVMIKFGVIRMARDNT